MSACQTGSKFPGTSLESSNQIGNPISNPIRGLKPYLALSTPNELTLLNDSSDLINQVGYVLYDTETKKVLSQLNPNRAFIPASVTKVLSTVAALEILGPQHRFTTELFITGKIRNHILYGDLYLKGTGDPLLTAADLMSLAEALHQKGIRNVKGNFYFDEAFLPASSTIDSAHDFSATYNSGFSALSSEFNLLSLYWIPSSSPLFLETYALPPYSLLKTEFSPAVTSKRAAFKSETIPNQETWLLSPDLPTIGQQTLPVKNPAFFTASYFSYLAQMHGVTFPSPLPRVTPLRAKRIAQHRSLPLIELTEKVLEFSNNLMAELIHLNAARKLHGKGLPLKEASQLIAQWYKKQLPKDSWTGFILENGSGLGSENRISPLQLKTVLEFADQGKQKHKKKNFLTLLPISGWKGSLAKRMNVPSNGLRVWAKTGSQGFCNSLAGYLFTKTGKKLIFALLATDYDQRAQVDLYEDQIPPMLAKKAQIWADQIRLFQDQLLTHWIEVY